MRDYGVVSPKFWIGGTGKSLRGNKEAQIVALYLMTSPHANMIGVFYCPLDTVAKETGLTSEGAWKGLQSLIEADFAQFDADTEEVFAVRMAAYQVGEQLEAKDNRCKGVARELERVMSDRLRSAFRATYSVAFHLPDCGPKAPPSPPAKATPSEAPPKPETGSEAEAETEAEKKDSGPALRAPPPPPPFDGKNSESLNGKAIVQIAGDWELPEQWGVDAEALGWKPAQVLREAEKFRQYWTAGKGQGKRRTVKGWRQSWSNWLEKAAKDQR